MVVFKDEYLLEPRITLACGDDYVGCVQLLGMVTDNSQMKVRCLYDKLVPIEELKAHPKNRNKHPKEQIERLAGLLSYQGWRDPIKVSKRSGCITAGHGRLLSAKSLGWKEVPVSFQDYESEELEYAHVQSDNAIASWAELDLSAINTDLADLGPDFDIDMLGIKDFVLEPADKYGEMDSDEVPLPGIQCVNRGDLYTLGHHRLLCGDSTSSDDVARLMNGEKADMVHSDPPYGFAYKPFKSLGNGQLIDGKGRSQNEHRVLANDSGDWDFDASFIFEQFPYCEEVFLWGADYYCWTLPKKGSWVVWNKIGDNEAFDKVPGASFELCWSKSAHKRHLIGLTWRGCYGHNVKLDGDRKVHPTQKPVKLYEFFCEKWSKPNDVIVEHFSGSGSHLIACERTGRRYRGLEIDPIYCGVILDRWAKFTGKDPIREDGKPWSEIKTDASAS